MALERQKGPKGAYGGRGIGLGAAFCSKGFIAYGGICRFLHPRGPPLPPSPPPNLVHAHNFSFLAQKKPLTPLTMGQPITLFYPSKACKGFLSFIGVAQSALERSRAFKFALAGKVIGD